MSSTPLKTRISSTDAPAAIGPYAQAVRDAVVRRAGGIGRDGAVAATSEAAFKAILRAAGSHDAYPKLAEAAGRASDRAALMRAARDLHAWAEGMSLGRQ